MNFLEFEKIMNSKGISSLAEMARALDTTPQAVSNWKGRDQVPMHVAAKIYNEPSRDMFKPQPVPSEVTISISDLLLKLAQNIKVIFLSVFICAFTTFTYTNFIKEPLYTSYAKIVLPSTTQNQSFSRIAGLASQFGVEIPSGQKADLSSPTLLPELIKSRKFFENVMNENFFTQRFQKDLSLLEILIGKEVKRPLSEKNISDAFNIFSNKIVKFSENVNSQISLLSVTTLEAQLSKKLAELILKELESLNKFYKSQTLRDKTNFIDQRIASVNYDLELSEKKLKDFNENNRQISTPSLQLSLDRLERQVEVQKGIYLTLKQQLELAKIESVEEGSIMQILDSPQIPVNPASNGLIISTMLSVFIGLFLGVLAAFSRAYLNNNDIDERRKIRRVKIFLNKKSKDIFSDRRILGTVCILMFFGLPYYLNHESSSPTFFGKYSTTMLLINILYITILLIFIALFVSNKPSVSKLENKNV